MSTKSPESPDIDPERAPGQQTPSQIRDGWVMVVTWFLAGIVAIFMFAVLDATRGS